MALPTEPTLDAYGEAWNTLKQPLLTSLIITLGGAFGSIFLGSICAYGLSKFRFKFDNLFFLLLTVAIYLPYQAILVPLLRTINFLGLYDTYIGLILIHTVYGMPMCTSMFRSFYSDQSRTASSSRPWSTATALGHLPQDRPANTTIATVTVLVFQCTSIWNEMLFALTMGGFDCMPATIALNQLVGTLSARLQHPDGRFHTADAAGHGAVHVPGQVPHPRLHGWCRARI